MGFTTYLDHLKATWRPPDAGRARRNVAKNTPSGWRNFPRQT